MMFSIEIVFPDGRKQRARSRDTSLMIGKGVGCKININDINIKDHHAELFIRSHQVFVRTLDLKAGMTLNGERKNLAGPLSDQDVLRLGNHELKVRWNDALSLTPFPVPDSKPLEQIAILQKPNFGLSGSEEKVLGPMSSAPASTASLVPSLSQGEHPMNHEVFHLRKILQNQLVDAFGIRRVDVHHMEDHELRKLTEKIILDLIDRLPDLPSHVDREGLMMNVRDEAIGLGLLEPLLSDPSITEIMVNASDEIFVERSGRLQRLPMAFTSDQTVLGIIERIVAPIGRRIDESSPMVDARLKDGSRVNAVIPPLALKGPSLTIRKFSKRKLGADDLLKFGSASPRMIEFLRVCVEQHKNIIISGGTGSGKTTLLNILSNFIPEHDRIVTIEDAAELQLHHSNLVSMESRPANLEGKGQITIRELVKNALRMRPDRIVVGECRGGEALDMLQAMNTGHDGSLTTAHANTPRDMLSRLEVMVLMAGMDLPIQAIREQVSSAVNVIVQQSRLSCGSRKITSIVEVTGIESGRIQLQEIFAYVQEGFDAQGKTIGHFTGRGCVPEFYEKLAARGVPLNMGIFQPASTQTEDLRKVRA